MKLKPIDIAAVLGYVVGGGLTGVLALGGPRWTAMGPAIISVAGLLRIAYNPTDAPAKAVVANAPIVTSNGTPTGATNISSSSQLLAVNQPQKAD